MAKVILVVLILLSWACVLVGAWRDVKKRSGEGARDATWQDVLDLRQLIFSVSRAQKWSIAVVVVGGVMNAVASIWSLYVPPSS